MSSRLKLLSLSCFLIFSTMAGAQPDDDVKDEPGEESYKGRSDSVKQGHFDFNMDFEELYEPDEDRYCISFSHTSGDDSHSLTYKHKVCDDDEFLAGTSLFNSVWGSIRDKHQNKTLIAGLTLKLPKEMKPLLKEQFLG